MLDASQTLLDLTETRHIAGYVLALLALSRLPRAALLALRLRSQDDAHWLATRLGRQGYSVVAIETLSNGATLKVQRTD